MRAVAHRRDWTSPGAILLPLGAVSCYGLATGIGFLWPERPGVAIGAAITVSVLLWLVSALWFHRRTGWWRWVTLVVFALALVFPMVGSAQLGTDLALEQHGEQVTGEVVDIAVEQTNRRRGEESWRTTYTFVSAEDRSELGTVDYRGDKGAHHLEVGDRTELIADPRGELPLKLAETVDSSRDVGMLVVGGVFYAILFGIGLLSPLGRRGP